MRHKGDTPDRLVAQIAAHQHGVISTRQLHDNGIDRDWARRRVAKGWLHRVHQGVYAVGHLPRSRESRWMAAALACGDGAVLSHRSAAHLWGILPPSGGAIEVSIPRTSGCRRRAGIRLHRRRSLDPDAVTRHRSIPVTSAARTIADLRRGASPAELRRAIRQAEVLGLRTGLDPPEPTRSELEDLFLALCRHRRLPKPAVNVRVGTHVVDFLWPRQRVVVETDGYRYHRGATAFEDDRARDLELRLLGYEVIRVSFHQVTEHPERVATAVRDALRDR